MIQEGVPQAGVPRQAKTEGNPRVAWRLFAIAEALVSMTPEAAARHRR